MPKPSALIIYMPVLHRGYMQLFKAHPEIKHLLVIGDDLLESVDYLRKDLRSLSPKTQVKVMKGLGVFDDVEILTSQKINVADTKFSKVIFPDEDISREIATKFKKAKTEFYPIFLRWDRRNFEKTSVIDPDARVSNRKVDKDYIKQAYLESVKSTDIWRRVGVILVDKNNKEIGRAYNHAEPSGHSATMEGDPRSIFNQGVNTDIAIFMHAEATLVADAAKHGKKLAGASIYTTTFPCPWCAKMIAYSGVSKIYYAEGYGSLDANRLFKDFGIKTHKVDYKPPDDLENPAVWVPYKKS
jgi:dCMP deaminase